MRAEKVLHYEPDEACEGENDREQKVDGHGGQILGLHGYRVRRVQRENAKRQERSHYLTKHKTTLSDCCMQTKSHTTCLF
jgi:hypothetical protein